MRANVTAERHVVVIGGGVIGLASAYHLRRAGAEVTLLERAAIGAGASRGNSGWIAPSFSAPLPGPGMTSTAVVALARPNGSLHFSTRHLPRMAPWLWRFWRASTAARQSAGLRATAKLAAPTLRLYDELVADGVRFQMRRNGVLHAFARERTAAIALRELAPLRDFGFEVPDAVITGPRLRELEPALGAGVAAGFVVASERTVIPHTLLEGLKARLRELGATVHEHRAATGFVTRGQRVTGVVAAPGAPIEADVVVIAAGVWSRELAAQLGIALPLEAGKGYSFTVRPRLMPTHSLHMFEAKVTASPFPDGLRLAGTMEFSGTSRALNHRRVAAVARAARPYLSEWREPARRDEWMGMRPMTPDGLPVLGRARGWQNVHLATGHGMLGVTLAPATGRSVARLIVGEEDPEELRAFNADRFTRQRRHA